jgi:hypothetical protein
MEIRSTPLYQCSESHKWQPGSFLQTQHTLLKGNCEISLGTVFLIHLVSYFDMSTQKIMKLNVIFYAV